MRHINIRSCPCPVLGCKYNTGHHLDRHIVNTHSELSDTQKEEMLSRARTSQARLLLGELRASMSTPAMVSDFDKRELEELYAPAGQVVEQQPSSSQDPVCCSAACADLLKSYKSELDTMAKIRVDLEARVEQQQRTITTLKRLVASLRRKHAPTAQKVKRKRTEVEEASTSGQLEPHSGGESQVTEKQETTTSAAPSNLPTPKEGIQIPGAEKQIVLPIEAIRAEEEKETAGPASFSWSAGTGKGNLMRRIILPQSMELYLKWFQKFHTSTQATPKMIEAAKLRVSRVKAFLQYMSEGQQKISDWTFLHNVERIKKKRRDS
ncbi:hypothetical protein AMECASPLE_028570 [Ameca splendens]|uniref:Uncharacterized protein n=1 Tax=Ameca splendens TaxID=208324 RepID=A0ABV1A2K6_9TELE